MFGGLRVRLVGFKAEDAALAAVKTALVLGGAFLMPNTGAHVLPGVTHVVLGPECGPAEREIVAEHYRVLGSGGTVAAVRHEWVAAAAAAGGPVARAAVDRRYLVGPMEVGKLGADDAIAPLPGTQLLPPPTALPAAAAAPTKNAVVPPRPTEPVGAPVPAAGSVLRGLRIYLSGGQYGCEVYSRAQEAVVSQGGDFTGGLSRRNTHCILALPEGEKHAFALK